MPILFAVVDLWNALPDSVRILDSGNPLWMVLRLLALATGNTLFEDASFGP